MTSDNTGTEFSAFHSDLDIVKGLVYNSCGISLTNLKVSKESVEYGACSFELNGKLIQHRVSKITPSKTGQFVTIWKRGEDGFTEPFDSSDALDFIIITARRVDSLGQFVFPKQLLIDKGIITHNYKNGKRGIRVYSPWDIATSKQAQRTQSWQVKFFLEIKDNNSTDLDRAKKLLCL